MGFIRQLFTWWNQQTLGTRLFTASRGVYVGEDGFGNRYYRTRDGVRRWVIYSGEAEASSVPADWHGWLHHTYEQPPSEAPLPKPAYELPHLPNMTGTPLAYRPKGSIAEGAGRRAHATGDYEPWTPN